MIKNTAIVIFVSVLSFFILVQILQSSPAYSQKPPVIGFVNIYPEAPASLDNYGEDGNPPQQEIRTSNRNMWVQVGIADDVAVSKYSCSIDGTVLNNECPVMMGALMTPSVMIESRLAGLQPGKHQFCVTAIDTPSIPPTDDAGLQSRKCLDWTVLGPNSQGSPDPGTTPPPPPPPGTTPAQIPANSITADKLAANSVGASEIIGVDKLIFSKCITSSSGSVNPGSGFEVTCNVPGVLPGDNIVATPNSKLNTFVIKEAIVKVKGVVAITMINTDQLKKAYGQMTIGIIAFK